MSDYDVAVIGAGPGGTATAIWCAQKGLKVILIEEKSFPRYRPGETLHPGIEPLLKQLGVLETVLEQNFLRHQGHWVQWGKESQFVPFGADEQGTWLGFQAWRADFDQLLKARSQSLGVQVLQPCRAIRPLIEQGKIIGLETTKGKIYSHFLVDAAGSHHWLARQLKIPINYYSHRLIAYCGYVSGNCPSRDDNPALIADEFGWTWMARVRPHLYQWTRLLFKTYSFDKNWLPVEFKKLQPVGKARGTDVTWRRVSQTAGAGYFMVGDAASILDPASSHGVLKAIMSGIMAGDLIHKTLIEGYSQKIIIAQYLQWITRWFEQDLQELKKFYAMIF